MEYTADIMKCVLAIESIYPSIAMYDEPRNRLVSRINCLIHEIVEAELKKKKYMRDLVREYSENTTENY